MLHFKIVLINEISHALRTILVMNKMSQASPAPLVKNKNYVWKRYVLVRSHDTEFEEKVILGIHTLNMNKLTMITEESQPFFENNLKKRTEEID